MKSKTKTRLTQTRSKPTMIPQMVGLVSVGTKGQIVIPVATRKTLNLKSGDKLVVMQIPGGAFTFFPTDSIAKMLEFHEQLKDIKQSLNK